jgi:MFS family permease
LVLASQTCFVVANTLLAHYSRWVEFLGGSVRQVGMIMGAGAVVGLLLRPWMGQWIDRLGSRRTWVIGCGVFAIGSFGNLLLTELTPVIYLVRSCLVLGAAIVFASSLTYITQMASPSRRTEAIGILGVGGFLGMLLGPALGDLLLSSQRLRGNFVTLFVVAAIGSVVPAILLCFLRAAPGLGSKSAVRLADFVRMVRQNWPGTILLVDLAFGLCMTAPFVFLASYVDEGPLEIPGVSTIGLFFWCYAGWGLIVRVTVRRMADTVGRRKMLLAGMFLMSMGMFCFWFVDEAHAWMIIVPALITGTAHGLVFHTMTSLTIESFPSEVRGTGSALTLMMLDMGMILGAPILGQIAETFGFNWMYTAIGVFSLVAAATYGYSSIPVWQHRRRTRFAKAIVCSGSESSP